MVRRRFEYTFAWNYISLWTINNHGSRRRRGCRERLSSKYLAWQPYERKKASPNSSRWLNIPIHILLSLPRTFLRLTSHGFLCTTHKVHRFEVVQCDVFRCLFVVVHCLCHSINYNLSPPRAHTQKHMFSCIFPNCVCKNVVHCFVQNIGAFSFPRQPIMRTAHKQTEKIVLMQVTVYV